MAALSSEVVDLVVIGGGSGGLSCAKRAASYGARTIIVESSKFGGTCVNLGCVPKKVMFNASHVLEAVHEAKNFGYCSYLPNITLHFSYFYANFCV